MLAHLFCTVFLFFKRCSFSWSFHECPEGRGGCPPTTLAFNFLSFPLIAILQSMLYSFVGPLTFSPFISVSLGEFLLQSHPPFSVWFLLCQFIFNYVHSLHQCLQHQGNCAHFFHRKIYITTPQYFTSCTCYSFCPWSLPFGDSATWDGPCSQAWGTVVVVFLCTFFSFFCNSLLGTYKLIINCGLALHARDLALWGPLHLQLHGLTFQFWLGRFVSQASYRKTCIKHPADRVMTCGPISSAWGTWLAAPRRVPPSCGVQEMKTLPRGQ